LDKGPDQAVGGHYPVLINKPLYDVIGNPEKILQHNYKLLWRLFAGHHNFLCAPLQYIFE
jgi:hypothetical protein